MTDHATNPHTYSLAALGHELRAQLPSLLRHRRDFAVGFSGAGRLDGATRLAVQLRMARVLGCPVCAGLFPLLARPAGLSDEAVRSAFAGQPGDLSAVQYGAVAWAGEVLRADGAAPRELPEPALALSDAQREHLLYVMRLELVVHATGLMFLPHRWIERARLT